MLAPATEKPRIVSQSSTMSIIRYAAGSVPMKLMKRYEKQSSKVGVEYVECLSSMAVNGYESSLEAYALEWSRKLNRGGFSRLMTKPTGSFERSK